MSKMVDITGRKRGSLTAISTTVLHLRWPAHIEKR